MQTRQRQVLIAAELLGSRCEIDDEAMTVGQAGQLVGDRRGFELGLELLVSLYSAR